jgi:hypothetical protein
MLRGLLSKLISELFKSKNEADNLVIENKQKRRKKEWNVVVKNNYQEQ